MRSRVSRAIRSAKIRLIEILNDRGYAESDPQPQEVVWERMNLPIARGLRGLIFVLSDLSQVDPSDLVGSSPAKAGSASGSRKRPAAIPGPERPDD